MQYKHFFDLKNQLKVASRTKGFAVVNKLPFESSFECGIERMHCINNYKALRIRIQEMIRITSRWRNFASRF